MISESLAQIARARPPGQYALVDGEVRLTYARLLELRDRLRRFFTHGRGLRGGDVVGLSLHNSWQFVVSFLALVDFGSIAVPLSPHYRSHEIGEILERIGPSSIIADQEQCAAWLNSGFPAGRLIADNALQPLLSDQPGCPDGAAGREGASPAVPVGSRAEDQRDGDDSRPTGEDTLAVLLLTSGSTGSPKMVPRSHRNLLGGAGNVGQALGELAGARFLGVVPFFHANGFANGMLLSLLSGGTLVVVRRFLPAGVLQLLKDRRIDVLVGSPYIYKALSHLRGISGGTLAGVRICLSSGSAMTAQLTQQCYEQLGARVRQLYGSTESGTISIEAADSAPDRVTAGRPCPGVALRIGERQEELDGSTAGEVQVCSKAMMTGYWGEPELNSESFSDGYLRTGDFGYLDAIGNLVLTGRRKRFINLYGIKVDPIEIENVIATVPGVTDCAVIGVRSGATEIIKATVGVSPGVSIERGLIVEHCRAQLAEFKIPRIIETVEGPLTDLSGKRRHQGGPHVRGDCTKTSQT
jgi:acyl-CoA synthetase (AMP-forming)/AMP-acid ligase II